MNDFAQINEVYATFFDGNYPSRSCVEVARLPKDVLVEIEAIATDVYKRQLQKGSEKHDMH